MNRNRKILFFGIMIFLLTLSSCGGEKGERDFQIALLKGPSAMGMVNNLDSVKLYTEPLQVRKAMLESEADFAALPMNMAAILYNKGLPYSLVAVPVSGSLYLAGSDTTVKNWSDLKGKRVQIMAKGMTPDLLFRFLLKENGLEPNKDLFLDYNYPTHTDMASALAAGRVSLGVITEPYLSMVITSNKNIHPLLDLNTHWRNIFDGDLTETAFLVKTSLLRENPSLVEDVLERYMNSISWVNNYPDSASALMVKAGIISDSLSANSAIKRSHLHFRGAKECKAEIDLYLRILFEMSPEIIGGKLPDEEFYQ